MTFTDDDLKRLKESMEAKPESLFISCFEIQDMKALLARLAAAEKALEHVQKDILDENPESWDSEKVELLMKAWRKACGK